MKKNYLSSMRSLLMLFNETTLKKHNVTVELKLQGRNLAAHRDIQAHLFYHNGDVMKLDKYNTSYFRVQIKKRVFIEGEPCNTCRNYPNSDFKSYRECDDHYMRRKVNNATPGLVPLWMTGDLSKVTTKPVTFSHKAMGMDYSTVSDIMLILCIPSYSGTHLAWCC